MEKKVKIIPENIHLQQINVVESNIRSKENISKNTSYKLNVAHTTMHNLKDERIKIGLIVQIIAETDQKGTGADFNIDFHFKIDDLNNFYELKEENPVFSGLLIATLLGISFSTARGLIYERLMNTSMEGLILPVVSPQKMLQNRERNKDQTTN